MNLHLSLFIQLAGLLQLLTAAANFFLPAMLHYRENLARVTPIIRQIFTVHSIYIVLVLIGFGLICLFYTNELAGATSLGRFLSAFLALFFAVVFLYLAVTFIVATFHHP